VWERRGEERRVEERRGKVRKQMDVPLQLVINLSLTVQKLCISFKWLFKVINISVRAWDTS
jgi:hypothetical protein